MRLHRKLAGTCSALLLILLAALVLRVALLATPRSFHPDEAFQYLEQAHRLVFGYGVVPWEYRSGIRSWLLPVVLSGPMALGHWFAPGSAAYLLLPRLCLIVLSLGSVVAAHRLGQRISPRHGLAAALAAAFWPEFALFAGQALTDSIAVPLVLIAAAALPDRQRGGLALAGALLALAVAIRFPIGPAIAVLVVVSLRADWRAWGWLALGGLAGLALAALPDVALGHVPYGWMVENWRQNMIAGHAQGYGVDGPFFYTIQLLAVWAVWLFPALWLAWQGARHYPALAAMAVANLLVHSAIAHKELRFILLSGLVLVILAALGSVDVWQRWPGRRNRRLWLGGWALAAVTVLMMPGEREDWDDGVPPNRAFAQLRGDDATCGVALWRVWWASTRGYTYLHRPVPLYLPDRMADPRAALLAHQAAFNTIVASSRLAAPLPPGFVRVACHGPQGPYGEDAVCIWRRPGGCDGAGAEALLINQVVGTPDQPGDHDRWTARGN